MSNTVQDVISTIIENDEKIESLAVVMHMKEGDTIIGWSEMTKNDLAYAAMRFNKDIIKVID